MVGGFSFSLVRRVEDGGGSYSFVNKVSMGNCNFIDVINIVILWSCGFGRAWVVS